LSSAALRPSSLGGARPRAAAHSNNWRATPHTAKWRSACAADPNAACTSASSYNGYFTELQSAIEEEDYERAALARQRLLEIAGDDSGALSWDDPSLGLPDWLADRACDLGYPFPTEVQAGACVAAAAGSSAVAIRSATGSGKSLALLLPLIARIDYGLLDIDTTPQAVVAAPTKELAVQLTMLVWRLLGGNVSNREPGDTANIFRYQGPRLVKVRALFEAEMVERLADEDAEGLKGVHVLVGTPQHLLRAVELGLLPPASVRIAAVDEADELLSSPASAAERVLQSPALEGAQVFAAGATFDAASSAFLGGGADVAVVDVRGGGTLPEEVEHRLIVAQRSRHLPLLCRLVREAQRAAGGEDVAPVRTIVYVPDAATAAAAAPLLRAALWGTARLSVCSSEGREPLLQLEAFRNRRTSMLLATPHAERGLDLPDVAQVICVGATLDETAYLHRAGRLGRIGSNTSAPAVTTLCAPEDASAFRALCEALSVIVTEVPIPAEAEDVTTRLEDLYVFSQSLPTVPEIVADDE